MVVFWSELALLWKLLLRLRDFFARSHSDEHVKYREGNYGKKKERFEMMGRKDEKKTNGFYTAGSANGGSIHFFSYFSRSEKNVSRCNWL